MSATTKGRDLLMEISDDAGATWKVIGGIRTKEFNRDNPVSDITNQASDSNETESAYDGYSTVTLNGNGVVDTTASVSVAAYTQLSQLANSSTPEALLRLSDAIETYQGTFMITSFAKTTEQQGQVEFTAAFQNKGVVTFTSA